jgi:hypothetical protein
MVAYCRTYGILSDTTSIDVVSLYLGGELHAARNSTKVIDIAYRCLEGTDRETRIVKGMWRTYGQLRDVLAQKLRKMFKDEKWISADGLWIQRNKKGVINVYAFQFAVRGKDCFTQSHSHYAVGTDGKIVRCHPFRSSEP